jgi:hypothetical protein
LLADPAVYILAGVIPIESRIHKLALGMYANVCRTSNSIERELAIDVNKLLGLVHSSHVTQLPRDYTMCAWIFPYFVGFV